MTAQEEETLLRRTKSGLSVGLRSKKLELRKIAVLLDTFLMEELAESWWDPDKHWGKCLPLIGAC